MKKLLSLCLALLLAGCSAVPSPATSTPSAPPSSSVAPSSSSPATDASDGSERGNISDLDGIAVEKVTSTVTITFPASMYKGVDMSNFDAAQYVNKNGFISAVVQADGAVVVVMDKTKHIELMEDMRQSIQTKFEGLANDSKMPYIKKVTANNNFSQVTISVEKESFQSTFDVAPLNILVNIGFYQLLSGETSTVNIQVMDEATKEVLYNETFPKEVK